MSPLLFNIYIDAALAPVRKKCSGMEMHIADRTLHTLHYVNDQVLIDQDVDDIEFMTTKLYDQCSKWNMLMN